MLLSNYPSIDLHGFDSDYASIMVKDFISDNYIMGKEHILIVHGKGTGILKNRIHSDLKQNKLVVEFKLDMFNSGATIVTLKKKK